MTNSENSSTTQSHGKLIAVVVAAAVVIILAVLSAFVWPGWAIQKNDGTSTTTQNSQQKTESSEPTKPTIDATALPDDASELLKAMLEEYTLTYSTGDAAKDVTLVAAQWSSADNAKTQYDALVAAQTGDESASGNVKVSGNVTGAYVVKADASNSKNAVAIWQNDTVVFQATGTKEAVDRFYQKFPM